MVTGSQRALVNKEKSSRSSPPPHLPLPLQPPPPKENRPVDSSTHSPPHTRPPSPVLEYLSPLALFYSWCLCNTGNLSSRLLIRSLSRPFCCFRREIIQGYLTHSLPYPSSFRLDHYSLSAALLVVLLCDWSSIGAPTPSESSLKHIWLHQPTVITLRIRRPSMDQR